MAHPKAEALNILENTRREKMEAPGTDKILKDAVEKHNLELNTEDKNLHALVRYVLNIGFNVGYLNAKKDFCAQVQKDFNEQCIELCGIVFDNDCPEHDCSFAKVLKRLQK